MKLEKEDDSIKDRIVRGRGTLTFNSLSVVDIYNHKYGDISQYKYLDNYSEENKIRAYILGTIAHEIGGHHFCNKVLKLSERKEYKEICKNEETDKSVTYYVEKHKKGIFFGNIYDEDFSESMRRFVTDYDEFKNEFPKRARFIEKKFPEVAKNGIKDFIKSN